MKHNAAKNPSNTLWYNLTVETVLADLKTNPAGLSEDEAQQRLALHGPNCLPSVPKTSIWLRFFKHFDNMLMYILLGTAVITAFLDHWVDTWVIVAVVLANAAIGFIQEGKAEKAMDAIQHMLSLSASVIRNGERRNVDSENLVVGDIVWLEAGDKVPADIRLLQENSLFVQEAMLTGESLPVEKNVQPVVEGAPLGDRTCMVFSGTLVLKGQAVGVVVATAIQTEIGRIRSLLKQVEVLSTPFIQQMAVFSKWLTLLILLIAALLLIFSYFVGHQDFSATLMAVVGLSVAAIPEGLPTVLTITLAIGMQSMARRNVIVRSLPSIETLGAVSVICTDKTGTLTRNEMMVSSLLTHDRIFTLDGEGYEPKGRIMFDELSIAPSSQPLFTEIGHAAALCNDAKLYKNDGAWAVEGDPMEGALLALSHKIGVDLPKLAADWRRMDAIAFDAVHRFMATLHFKTNDEHKKQAYIFVKGAPENILDMCNTQRIAEGGVGPLNKNYWLENAENIAAKGQRVLALAVKLVGSSVDEIDFADVGSDLILLGMVGLIDPPRADAIKAVAECQAAGIEVKMITGDHAGTAAAIGQQVGLNKFENVLTGVELDKMDDAVLKQAVLDTDVFARTTPEHKLRLVMALQSQGKIVAMTGDGVNDAPALKRADAGIAMGQKGSEVAKQAADLVLVDDNFISIAAAVREGRTVYDNIKKVISWTLPTDGGEALVILVALLMGNAAPITPVQILWINLITAVTLSIALAFEPTEENTMLRPPRPRNQPLLTGGLVWHIILVSILFLCAIFGIYSYAVDRGYSYELASTMALNTIVVLEIFHLFFIRNIYGTSLTWKAVRGTKIVWFTVVTVVIAQFAITYIPVLQGIFRTQSVSLFDGFIIVGIGVVFFAVIEIEKQIRFRIQAMQ